MEKKINLPGPIRNRVLGRGSALLASLVVFSRGALRGRAEGLVVSKPEALSFGDGGALDGLPALKPLKPGDCRPAKRRACNAFGNRSRFCDS